MTLDKNYEKIFVIFGIGLKLIDGIRLKILWQRQCAGILRNIYQLNLLEISNNKQYKD